MGRDEPRAITAAAQLHHNVAFLVVYDNGQLLVLKYRCPSHDIGQTPLSFSRWIKLPHESGEILFSTEGKQER
ncbi:hypothetical protein D3C73_1579440 [compost metagenome]